MVNCSSSNSNVADICVGEVTVMGISSSHVKLTRSTSAPNATGGRRNLPRNKEASGSNNMTRYKTELCHPFEENGHCKYAEKCQFAHGKQELRTIVRHPKYKTMPCRTFHSSGICQYGSRCHFIHAENKSVPDLNMVVNVPCTTTSPANGASVYRSGCHFMHDESNKSVPDLNLVTLPCPSTSHVNNVGVYRSGCHFMHDGFKKSVSDLNTVVVPCPTSHANGVNVYESGSQFIHNESDKSVPDLTMVAVSCPVSHANGVNVYESGSQFVQDESNKSVPDLNASTSSPPVGVYSKFASYGNNSSSYVSSTGTSLSSSSWENSCETTPSTSPPVFSTDSSGYEGLFFSGINNMSMTAFPLSSF